MAHRTIGAYGYFGEVAPTPGQIITDRVAAMVKVNDALYSALAAFRARATSTNVDRMVYEVENWHTNALKWMESADAASKTEEQFKGWKTWGLTLSRSADEIASRMGSSNVGAAVYAFAAGFPASLGLVTKKVVAGTAEVATDIAAGAGSAVAAAGWGVGKTLLFVGVPLALILMALTSGGRSLGVGPVRLGKR